MDTGIIGAAFAAGLLSFFSPCILPLLPVYIGLLTTDAGNQELGTARRAANTVAFVLGISVTFLILGLGAGAIGRALNNSYIAIVCGIIIFAFGLYLAGFLKIPFLNREKRFNTSKLDTGTIVGAFLLGLGFSFGWTPCIGPILGSILALAAQQGTAAAGAALTLVYSLGLSIPFLVVTLASNALIGRVRKINKYLPIIQRVGGVLIAIMGLWMIFTQVHELSASAPSETTSAANQQAASDESKSESANDAASSSASEVDSWRFIELEGVDGQTHTFADYEGTPIYIEFWGSWCPNCMDNMEEFQQMAAQHNAEGDVLVISVAAPGHFGEMDEEEFIEWCTEQGYDFPILMDSNIEINKFFNIMGYPSSVFVDDQGKVQLVRTGVVEPDEREGLFKVLVSMSEEADKA